MLWRGNTGRISGLEYSHLCSIDRMRWKNCFGNSEPMHKVLSRRIPFLDRQWIWFKVVGLSCVRAWRKFALPYAIFCHMQLLEIRSRWSVDCKTKMREIARKGLTSRPACASSFWLLWVRVRLIHQALGWRQEAIRLIDTIGTILQFKIFCSLYSCWIFCITVGISLPVSSPFPVEIAVTRGSKTGAQHYQAYCWKTTRLLLD